MILRERFLHRVREQLELRGMSQAELARRMSASPQFVSQYLAGHSCPGLEVVQRFADALEISDPVDLLKEPELQKA